MKLKKGIPDYDTPPIGLLDHVAVDPGSKTLSGLRIAMMRVSLEELHRKLADEKTGDILGVPSIFAVSEIHQKLWLWPAPGSDDYVLFAVYYPPMQEF